MVLHGQVSEQSCTKLTLVAKISDTKFGSAQNYNKAPTLQCSWKSSFIRHIRHFLWLLGPNVWWQVSQIWIEYIQLIGQMSDEPWKFFGYTDIGSKNVVDGNLRFFCYTCTNDIFATNLGIDLKFCNQIWYHWFQLPILICTWLMKKYSQETHIACRCLNLSCCSK